MFLLVSILRLSHWDGRAEDLETELYNLDQYVVTATRSETLLMQSPVAIGVVGSEELERRPVATLAEMLRDVPGVRVTDNSLPGMQRLRIRGEDARRSLVLIDGQEISDHSTFGPPLLIDPSFIERIEVVRGPHSTLYGSRATGGVINIITKQPTGADYFQGSIGSGYSGATGGHRIHASLAGAEGPWYYSLSSSTTQDGDRKTPQGILPDSSHESDGLMARLGWSEGNHNFSLLVDRFDMSSEASTRDDLIDGFIITEFLLDLPRRDREKLGFFYDGLQLVDGLDRLHIDAYRQTVDRNITQSIAGVQFPITTPPTLYDFLNDDLDTIDTQGLNVQVDWAATNKHTLITGFSYVKDTLDKSINRTGMLLKGPDRTPVNLLGKTESSIDTTAWFVQDTWRVNEQIQLSGGIRYYSVHSELTSSNDPQLTPKQSDDSQTIGSLTLVYQPREDYSYRFSWAQGYVFPTLLHLHTGSLFGQGNLTRPNPNLKPEQSENFEFGMRIQNERLTADLSVFFNQADNYIASVRASEVPELGWSPRENTYTNLDKAHSRGVEFLLSAQMPDSNLEWYGQGSYIRRELEFATFNTTYNGQPEWTGRTGLRHEQPFKKSMRWYFDAYVAAGDESNLKTSRSTQHTDSWTSLNLAAGMYIQGKQHWWIGVEALNLTDEAYRPSTDELWQPGRHLTLGVRVRY